MFIAIAAHTPLAGFALGISLVKAAAGLQMIIICISIFALTVPVGAAVVTPAHTTAALFVEPRMAQTLAAWV